MPRKGAVAEMCECERRSEAIVLRIATSTVHAGRGKPLDRFAAFYSQHQARLLARSQAPFAVTMAMGSRVPPMAPGRLSAEMAGARASSCVL